MNEDLVEDLRVFLDDVNLSTHEINVYIALLTSSRINNPTAKEISRKSEVPSGRIYEVLEDLKNKGMVEIIESRPKKVRAIAINKALDNLLTYQANKNKRTMDYLYDKAKLFESKLYNSEVSINKDPTRLFWATIFDTQSILSIYEKFINNAKKELLLNEFINRSTLKILRYGSAVYEPIRNAVKRGVKVKSLWSFQYNDQPLLDDNEAEIFKEFKKILKLLEELYGLSTELDGFDIKYVHKRIPTLYDIIDNKRVMFKLLNPVKPTQVFTCINVQDPKLAEELRNKFLDIWVFEAKGVQ
ncbi:MAG: TrmB family transcriptional regulator [Candidatus Lokiarchaeota archaeon]|nr:TrmB family transcriptional regulator [Candidatus Lokiarchaeota archaeon]